MKKNLSIKPKENDVSNLLYNFKEVFSTYLDSDAFNEASRCLSCINSPCKNGCPLNNDIVKINELIKHKKYEEAYEVLIETNPFPSICGRVCQQELQCEKACTLNKVKNSEAVAIGKLERFLGDKFLDKQFLKTNLKLNKKVAIIGSGPAGLACAEKLITNGIDVTIFEKEKYFGGLLIYGIPEFCLPRIYVDSVINKLKLLGVNFINNTTIETKEDLNNLFFSGFGAIFIAHGANVPRKMNIVGEDFKGVISAVEYLKITNFKENFKKPAYEYIFDAKKVVIVGGGNVAIDCDRMALRLGASHVYNLYRRSESEMPARKEEFLNAKKENVDFRFLTNPIEIISENNDKVSSIKCLKMELGELDASGRRKPIPIKGSEFNIDCDLVVMALGSISNSYKMALENGIKINKYGYFMVEEDTMETNVKNIYAGGDCVTGPTTVALAIKAGLKVANAIINKYKQNL